MIVDFCKTCGSDDVHRFEFRTDNAKPRIFDPVNEWTLEVEDCDIPYRLDGYYCRNCDSTCELETRDV